MALGVTITTLGCMSYRLRVDSIPEHGDVSIAGGEYRGTAPFVVEVPERLFRGSSSIAMRVVRDGRVAEGIATVIGGGFISPALVDMRSCDSSLWDFELAGTVTAILPEPGFHLLKYQLFTDAEAAGDLTIDGEHRVVRSLSLVQESGREEKRIVAFPDSAVTITTDVWETTVAVSGCASIEVVESLTGVQEVERCGTGVTVAEVRFDGVVVAEEGKVLRVPRRCRDIAGVFTVREDEARVTSRRRGEGPNSLSIRVSSGGDESLRSSGQRHP
jgi:hypothetical protein